MRLLNKKEADEQAYAAEHRAIIERICKAYAAGMHDIAMGIGYRNTKLYETKGEEIAYDIGWNQVAKAFGIPEKES